MILDGLAVGIQPYLFEWPIRNFYPIVVMMPHDILLLANLISEDQRYPIQAYAFVREALAFAADKFELERCEEVATESVTTSTKQTRSRHLSGQELCEGLRLYAVLQFGYMAKTVLNSWGIYSTSDFGNIVYNMIRKKILRKSAKDRRSHFEDVFDFEEAFENQIEVTNPLRWESIA